MAGEMASVNKVILMGTVTTVPDFRVLENGTMMVNLQLETVSAGETEKHHVIFFGHLGEIVLQYVHQDMPVYIEGRIRNRQYEDRNGNRHRMTTIVARKMQMLARKKRMNHRFPICSAMSIFINGYGMAKMPFLISPILMKDTNGGSGKRQGRACCHRVMTNTAKLPAVFPL